jgi:hypothetical protein
MPRFAGQDMASDIETRKTRFNLTESVCERYRAALRAGDTIDTIESWLLQVPEAYREELRVQLERCQQEINVSSVETRIMNSDAMISSGPSLFRNDARSASESKHISRCRTFHGLSDEAIEDLSQRLKSVIYAKGTVLLEQGTPARGLYLLIRGSVDVIDTCTGERIDCDGAGSVLGEMSLITGQLCSAGVIATSEVESLVLSTADYSELIRKHPELEIALSQLVSDRLGCRPHDALCGKVLSGYRLNRCLNRGGMGVVYQAESLETGEQVALKMLRHRFIYDTQMQERFEQEARLLSELNHLHVITLRATFLAFRTRFLVLDLCDGADLYRLLRNRGPFDIPTTKAILGQIASGLLAAHNHGIIHRDLKPGNVLVDRSGRIRITDFGLSRLLEAEGMEGKAVGTPSYMPPEQFRSGETVQASDWYALGCLACELLTGEMLFPGRDWFKLYDRKLNSVPSDTWPELKVDDELRELICGSLHPEVGRRRLDLDVIQKWAKDVPQLFQETS